MGRLRRREIVITGGIMRSRNTRELRLNQVEEGEKVKRIELVEGSINPHDLLRILASGGSGISGEGSAAAYRRQGVEIADKHIEIIVRRCCAGSRWTTPTIPPFARALWTSSASRRKMKIPLTGGGGVAPPPRHLVGHHQGQPGDRLLHVCGLFQETLGCSPMPPSRASGPALGLKENVIGKRIPRARG